jgi:thiosulfate/3-mercaptopyruvate sulfurtransferase
MLTDDLLRERLAAIGISDTSHVVVYYGKDWVSPSTRVIITLLNAGLSRVALLDGGMPAWTREGRPTSAAIPAAPPRGSLTALPPPRPLVVDAAFVLEHAKKPGYAVIDARNAEFYEGTRTGGSPERPHKAGHIPGARSVPFTDVTSEDLRLKSPAELSAAFARAGVRPGDTVIAYCHIGQQATAVMFAARTLGHPVLLYDGSFEDWSRRGLPVEAGPAPR